MKLFDHRTIQEMLNNYDKEMENMQKYPTEYRAFRVANEEGVVTGWFKKDGCIIINSIRQQPPEAKPVCPVCGDLWPNDLCDCGTRTYNHFNLYEADADAKSNCDLCDNFIDCEPSENVSDCAVYVYNYK